MPPGLTNDGVVVRCEPSCLDFGFHVHGCSPFVKFGADLNGCRPGLTNDGVVVRCEAPCLDLGFHVHGCSPFVEFRPEPKRCPPRLTNDGVVVRCELSGLDLRLDFHLLSPLKVLSRCFPLSLTAQNSGESTHLCQNKL